MERTLETYHIDASERNGSAVKRTLLMASGSLLLAVTLHSLNGLYDASLNDGFNDIYDGSMAILNYTNHDSLETNRRVNR